VYTNNFDNDCEEAIKFLVVSIIDSGNNPKPVIFHSTKVGMQLYDLGYGGDIVIAGILHDVIEDSSVKLKEIEINFGLRVSNLVSALSFDESIIDKTEQYVENFERCVKLGKDALIIRAVDLFYNCDYYSLASSQELKEWLFKKLNFFIINSKQYLYNETIYEELVKKYNTFRK